MTTSSAPIASVGAATATAEAAGPILLFDGVCNVCNASVQFVLRHERTPTMRFAALQSDAGRALIAKHNLPSDVSTVMLIDTNGRPHLRSSAVVRSLRLVAGPWRALGWLLWIVPKPLRDLGYILFASLRYRLFGKRDTCMIPTPEQRARFL